MAKLHLESPKMQIRALRDATRDIHAELGARYIAVTKTLALESDDSIGDDKELEDLLQEFD